MPDAAKLVPVVPSLNRGGDYRPGPGANGGEIPGSDVPAGPYPTPAPNSGTKLGSNFPNVQNSPSVSQATGR